MAGPYGLAALVPKGDGQRRAIPHSFSTRIPTIVGGKIIIMEQAEWWVGLQSGGR